MFNKKAPALLKQGVPLLYVRAGSKIRLDKKENELVTYERLGKEPERAAQNLAIKGEGICLLDFDVWDKKAAAFLLVMICKELNISQKRIIVRYGTRPKFGIPFIFVGNLKSSKSATYENKDGKPHQFETKADRTYWVAHGYVRDADGNKTHYKWEVGGKIVDNFSLIVDDLPVLTQDNIDNINIEFIKAAKKFGWPLLKKAKASNDNDWFIDTDTMDDMSIDKMRYYLDAIDPDEWLDYESFTSLGMAIYHQTKGSDDGLELYVECCERMGEAFDEDECNDKWETYNAGDYTAQPVRFHSIVKKANDEYSTSEAQYYEECVIPGKTPWKEKLAGIVASQWMSNLDKDVLLPQLHKSIDKDKRPSMAVLRGELKKQDKVKKSEEKEEDDSFDAEYALSYLRSATMEECEIRSDEIIFNAGDPWIVTDNIWHPVAAESVTPLVYEALEKIRDQDTELYNSLSGTLTNVNTIDNVSEMIYRTLRKVNAINIKGIDPLALTRTLPMVINCLDKELWFDPVSGKMGVKAHDLTNYFTFGINAKYDPKATCPRFDEALGRIFDRHIDSDYTIAYLFELMGYLLQPTREKAMFLLWKGSGSNGKSFVSSILIALMGDSVLSLSKKADDSPHFTASLVGKQLMIDPDFDEPLLSDGTIKKYSEDKLETANPKFGRTYQFRLRTIMLILSNTWPRTKDMSAGVTRRAQIIDFNTVIPDEEVDLSLKGYVIEHELPGVLNRCIEGLVRLIKNGYIFTESEDCIVAKKQWLTGSNPLRAYLHERCVIKIGGEIVGSELFADYKQYIGIIGGGRAKGRNQFYKDITDMKGVSRIDKDHQPWFGGIALSDNREDLEADMFE